MKKVIDGLAYPVVVSTAAVREAADVARRLGGALYIVADENVQARADELAAALVGRQQKLLGHSLIAAGERCKRWKTVELLHAEWLMAGLDRTSVIFAVGGGTLTDVVGFAAATFMRGVPWVAMPTTMLGMVDAAIGGKTGIDVAGGKNLAGSFWHPSAVIADITALETLPLRERRAGISEAVKAAVIGDPQLLMEIDRRDIAADATSWTDIVARAASVKARIVARDETDRSERAALNLGHTFAHAIETASNYRIPHGEAVAIGLRAAGIAAHQLNGWTHEDHRRVLRCLRHAGLRVHLARLDPDAVTNAMQADKKRRDGLVGFVLPVKLGEVQTGVHLPTDVVSNTLKKLQERWIQAAW